LSSHLLSKNFKFKISKIILLLVVLYGCETWSLTLREECGLRVFKNRVLRRIFGPREEGWRRLHNVDFIVIWLTGLSWLRIRFNGREFLDWFSICQMLK